MISRPVVGPPLGFNPDELVPCRVVRALKLCCRLHSQRMGSGPLKRIGEMKRSDLI